MVRTINLGVALVLAVVLVVGFCQRHKWSNGKSIFGHLLKGGVCILVGKTKKKRRDTEAEKSSLEEGTKKDEVVKLEEVESDRLHFQDETRKAQDEIITKTSDEKDCKDTDPEIVAHIDTIGESARSKGESATKDAAALIKQPTREDEKIPKEETSQV